LDFIRGLLGDCFVVSFFHRREQYDYLVQTNWLLLGFFSRGYFFLDRLVLDEVRMQLQYPREMSLLQTL
jgi:hypothetical protein